MCDSTEVDQQADRLERKQWNMPGLTRIPNKCNPTAGAENSRSLKLVISVLNVIK